MDIKKITITSWFCMLSIFLFAQNQGFYYYTNYKTKVLYITNTMPVADWTYTAENYTNSLMQVYPDCCRQDAMAPESLVAVKHSSLFDVYIETPELLLRARERLIKTHTDKGYKIVSIPVLSPSRLNKKVSGVRSE